jgi:hypothetical protein
VHGRDPSSEKRHLPRISEWNFGALVMLAALSIAGLVIMPEIFTQ